jgi:putative Holliday junction resolvase
VGRILALDVGARRTGLAVTDPLQIIAGPLETVETAAVLDYLENYTRREPVDAFVVGMPRKLDNTDSDNAPLARKVAAELMAKFPAIPVHFLDERFTTSIARRAMLEGGMKKKDRKAKGAADTVSAVILLQDYLTSRDPRKGG